MVLSFLRKHKKFFKSTKNSTERRKVFNIYPHSVHIPKLCTETRVKAPFAPYPSVGSPLPGNARRRKKNRQKWRFSSFPFFAVRFLLQNLVYFGHALAPLPVVALPAEGAGLGAVDGHAFFLYGFLVKYSLILYIFVQKLCFFLRFSQDFARTQIFFIFLCKTP